MTTTTSTATAPAPPRGFVRRNRTPLALGAAVVLALLLVTWLGRGDAGSGGMLDPGNPDPEGARAVAQVLGDHGVPVTIVRGRAELDDARVDADTTVVVSNPDELGKATWDDLDRRVRSTTGAVLVVIGLGPVVADGLGLDSDAVSETGSSTRVAARCEPAQPLMDGLDLTVDRYVLAVRGDGCFGDRSGRLLLTDRRAHRWVLTTGGPLSNAEVDRGDNAAVVLRLLGQRDRLVWYVADAGDNPAGDGVALSRLLPDWLVPGLWLIGIAALTLLVQRGRRLGPLVVEPIPVSIRALESTTSLGRLYEKARDREHAALLLVEGSAERIAAHLATASAGSRADLVRAVAARTGRSVDAVAALLPEATEISHRVPSDADLVTLAQDLLQLEEEVRTP